MNISNVRIGLGHDTHRLQPGNTLVLGGLKIPHTKEALGHSDADVLLHALTDALLGGASLGDIGELFPDNAAENKDRDSAEMLLIAYNKVLQAGWKIGNLDTIIFAQKPKLKEYKPLIQKRIAEILGIQMDQINIKAKTGEKVGPVGNEEAIQAEAIILLIPK
ncbi:MAG: 2-C-methyl-D-erythritol 2,4-cyclodiphosphate synthase [Pirellulaceae bacterium]|nr:2-C-methyl-D-erythritol 2,4-cyclodiphosphate synthase [Pirellulaceae bacterium]